MDNQIIRPILFWEGLPVCALLLKRVIKEFPNLIIVSTRPSVPFENIEELLGSQVHWLDDPNDIWTQKEQFLDRNFVIHTGWKHKGWLKFDKFIKNKNNAKIVVVVDNRFKKNFRQAIGSLYFRLFLRPRFDAAFVPGKEGVKLLNFFGMPLNRIYVGNYGASEEVYLDHKPIISRNKEFLFVGQLIKRKGLDILLEAFREYRTKGGAWKLRVVGEGPYYERCVGDGIIRDGFVQPIKVCSAMNDARVFVLVSRDEHWGTVVCEAAACGMGLITSRSVGSSCDLVRNGINGIELGTLEKRELVKAFFYFEKLDHDLLINASNVSKGIAQGYNTSAYYASFRKMISDLAGQ